MSTPQQPYHVTIRVGQRTEAFQRPLADPFARHTVTLGWRDLLTGLLRRRLDVTITTGGDVRLVNHVLDITAAFNPEDD